ncbi:hypothetical protein BDZ89DRAFT_1140198 [Hymenopellis radicata]|nr:hypothetical protein BDZ89DRAFT_1140198 [Hymenopellis radicata]
MISPLQPTLHRAAPFYFDTTPFSIGNILTFSLPCPFVELIPGVEATPSLASSPVPASSSPNQRPPHSCLVTGIGVATGKSGREFKITGYMMGTMNGGTLLNKIVAKSPTCSLLTSSGLVTIPSQDLFIPLHHPSTPTLQPPASDSGPAFFPDPPLAPAYIPDVPSWLNLSKTTVTLSRKHTITQMLNGDGEPVQVPMSALARIQSYINHRGRGGGKGQVGPASVAGSTGSRSDSDSDLDWDERPMTEEEMYLSIASLAQLSSGANFYTQALEALNMERAQKAKAVLDARAERVTEWLSHLA